MDLSDIVNLPLMDESRLEGWNKSTVDYVLNHKSKIYSTIRGLAKAKGKIVQRGDVDDIYMDLLSYLYSCDDYNINKAIERSSSGAIVSLEGYIHSCTKFCVIRFVTNQYSNEKNTVREHIEEDGKELSLFDTISNGSDKQYDNIVYSLDSICQNYESKRYFQGNDIFLLWFIRLQTIVNEKQNKYKTIIELFGISNKELSSLEKFAFNDGAMISIAKAVTLIGAEKASNIIKNYVYSADKIEAVVREI